MARFFLSPEAWGAQALLGGDEAKHAAQVLRLRAGDRITVFDGRGRSAGAEGSLRSLTDWSIWNDGPEFNPAYAPATQSNFTFQGYAVDGTSANFGNAPGVTGDGLADGRVTGSFNLTAGDYTILVGGGNYLAEGTANRGANITLSVIPEPAAAGFGATVLGTLALRRRRRA